MKLNPTKKYLLWIAELFVWLFILFMISGVITLARYTHRRAFNTYQVFLPDVDGLINGSPVRYMGIQVGYVNQVAIVGEDVYVKFIVTQKDFKLPRGAITTVEFTGLGGSKSLEIYPPKSPDKELTPRMLIAQQPKRIGDALGVLNDMFDKILKITFDVSNFATEVSSIKNNSEGKAPDKNTIGEFLDSADQWLDEINEKKNRLE